MKIKFICFLIICSSISCYSRSSTLTNKIEEVSVKEINQDFQKNYIGTINNKLNVVFQLKNTKGEISGFYFYENKGIDIKLIGKISNNKIVLYELDFQNNKVAELKGEINGVNFIGEWKSVKKNKPYPIKLKETNKKITVLPKSIEGIYKVINDESDSEKCNLSIKLSHKNGEYYYNFKSASRELNGKVHFSRPIDENAIYITLEGIEWAEYEGDISNQENEDAKKKELELPVGIDGLFSENQIDIQNYGNSMNYYTKLEDCGKKFIHLEK